MEIFNRKNVMIDIETFSTQQNAVIVSIGAVLFDFNDGIQDTFYVNVTPESCKEYGMHVCTDTLKWWLTQPKHIRDAWKVNPVSIGDALLKLNDFVPKDALVWSNGIVFDFGILKSAYHATNLQCKWKYINECDFRTIMTLLDVDVKKQRSDTSEYHNALGDAKFQAECLIKFLNPKKG